jgi:hypothetical protein
LIVYTFDYLAIGVNQKEVLTHLNKYFSLKPYSTEPPDYCKRTKIKLTALSKGRKAWGQSSSHFVLKGVKNLVE